MNRYSYRYLLLAVIVFLLGTVIISCLPQPASTHSGHGNHQTPVGWKFSWPPGDPVNGREVFVKLECYSCHEVKGEKFPAPQGEIGPELAMMGPLHEVEYFAEAIINPNAVIVEGKGYEAADGASKMPSYNDLLTVQEVIDLVAYLKGLKPPPEASTGHGSHGRHSH
jgi:cbb3-type cytochrome oxidase cytochrome c subunit